LKQIINKIIALPLIQVPLNLSKSLVLPGFDGLPIYDVIIFFIEGIQKNSLTTRASSLAFRFFLALFPSVIFLFSLIPYIPIDNFKTQLFELIRELLPGDAYDMASSTIEDLVLNKHDSLLSFGFLFALYLASNGINSMILAFNESFHSIKKGSFIKQRLVSLLLLFILTVLMILAIGLIIFSGIIINELIDQEILHDVIILLLITKFMAQLVR